MTSALLIQRHHQSSRAEKPFILNNAEGAITGRGPPMQNVNLFSLNIFFIIPFERKENNFSSPFRKNITILPFKNCSWHVCSPGCFKNYNFYMYAGVCVCVFVHIYAFSKYWCVNTGMLLFRAIAEIYAFARVDNVEQFVRQTKINERPGYPMPRGRGRRGLN